MSSTNRLGFVVFAAAGGVFLVVCVGVAVVAGQRGSPGQLPSGGVEGAEAARPNESGKVFEQAPGKVAEWTYTDLADHLRKKGFSPLTVVPGERGAAYFVFGDKAPFAGTMETLPHGDHHYPPYLRVTRWESSDSLRLELSRLGDPKDQFGWGRWCFYGNKDLVAKVRVAITG